MVMRTNTESGFCNLECWCHVPSRGIIKPPCYLCVIDSCSLSSKPSSAPTAPPLTAFEETSPPVPNLQPKNTQERQNGGVVLSHVNDYGWRATITRNASLSLRQRLETSASNFQELYVQLPPKGETQQLDSNLGIPQETVLGSTSGTYINQSRESNLHHNAAEIIPRGDLQTSTSGETDSNYVSLLEVNGEESQTIRPGINSDSTRAANLSDYIMKLAFNTESETSPNNLGREYYLPAAPLPAMPRDRVAPSLAAFREEPPRRRRNSKSQTNSAMTVSHEEISPRLDPEEAKYQQIHKIHRRDSSTDAANRYLQSDEHLHRMWFREATPTRRNRPGRGQRSRSFDSDNGIPNYGKHWRNLEKFLERSNVW